MIFNTEIKADKARQELERLIELKNTVEIKTVKQTRSSAQNRALHLLFEQVANELNDCGIPFIYRGLKGQELEMQWTKDLFKQFTWKPIQKALFDTETTTKLTTEQIDKIFDVICKFFAEKGIEISFPNQFDYYLKFYSNGKV